MRNFVLKMVVVVGAVISTWALTRSILANFKQEQPAEVASAEVTSSKKVVASKTANTYSKEAFAAHKKDWDNYLRNAPKGNSQHLKQFRAGAQGHILNVEAEVEINDNRKDKCYVWTLYVLNASDDSAQLVHVYDNQVFTIPESGSLNPTFQESTELPSGNYKVFLTLSRLNKDADLSPLKDPKILNVPISLRGFETVKID